MFSNPRKLAATVVVALLMALSGFEVRGTVAVGQGQERELLPFVAQSWLQKEIYGYLTLNGRPLAHASVYFFNGSQAFGGAQSDEQGFYNVLLRPEYHEGTTYGVLMIAATGDAGQPTIVQRRVSAYQWPEELAIETIAMDPIDLMAPLEGAIAPCNAETQFVWRLPAAIASEVSKVELEMGTVYTHNQHTYGPPGIKADVTGQTSVRLTIPCGATFDDLRAGVPYYWHIGVTTVSGLYRTTNDREITLSDP